MHKIIVKPRAEKEFRKLPDKIKKKFYEEFKRLSINPLAHFQVKKIIGTKLGYRLRIGRWRILFALFVEDKRIEIVDIFLKKRKRDYLRRIKLLE